MLRLRQIRGLGTVLPIYIVWSSLPCLRVIKVLIIIPVLTLLISIIAVKRGLNIIE